MEPARDRSYVKIRDNESTTRSAVRQSL